MDIKVRVFAALVALLFAGDSLAGTVTRPVKTFGGTSYINGVVPDATDWNGDHDTIYSEFNGNIDNNNIKSAAAIAGSKISPSFTNNADVTNSAPCFKWVESDQSADAKRWAACSASGSFTLGTYNDLDVVQNIWLTMNRASGHANFAAASIRVATPQAGQILIAGTDNYFSPQYLSAGAGISIATANSGLTISVSPTGGAIYGLHMSNVDTSDVINDIDITAGEALSDDSTAANRVILTGTAMTKQLDSAWTAGTGGGFRCNGGISDGTWHVYIFRTSSGSIDYCANLASLSVTLPSSGDKKRRIGSFRRESSAIASFFQNGDQFIRYIPILDINAGAPGTTAVTRTLSVPNNIFVEAMVHGSLDEAGGGNAMGILYLSSLRQADMPSSFTLAPLGQIADRAVGGSWGTSANPMRVVTNASGQIRSRASGADANTTLRIVTYGWIDQRGKDRPDP